MRKIIVLAFAATIVVSASAARADKSANAFIDPSRVDGGTNGFSNAYCALSAGVCTGNVPTKTYSVGAAKQSACKLKVQFQRLSGFADGEKMICPAGADACIATPPLACAGTGPGTTIVLHVPYSSLSLKAATKADTADIGCASADAISTNTSIHCYKWDGGYNPVTTCSGQGGSWMANPNFVVGGEATDGLVGLCQWILGPGTRLTPPGTGLVARDGLSTPAKP